MIPSGVDKPAPVAGARVVRLRNFRNYEEEEVALGEGLNVFYGSNAQGKTNFLEALYLLSTTRLLRGSREGEAIREGEQTAVVAAEVLGSRTEVSMKLERGAAKRASLNGLPLRRAADVIGRLPSVCASLLDLPILTGEPSVRRSFMDLELSQLSGLYLHHLAQYKRALEQRNALLRSAQEASVPAEAFEPWEHQMAEHGAPLRAARTRFWADLEPLAADVQRHMGSGESLRLAYQPKDPASDPGGLLEQLLRSRTVDVARGTTTVGPHRDDVLIEVGGRDARLYGSQGQQRTAALAIKLGTLELERRERGLPPLLLLDDILSDLDETRRARLAEWVLERAGQAVLTCTDLELVAPSVVRRARLFLVRSGRVEAR
ncbi:MAG: DNA replication/repair protein RecF [Fimbriimonadales bacterium]